MLEKNPNTETEMPSSIQVENDGHLISQTPYDYSTGSGPDFIHPRLRKENQLSKQQRLQRNQLVGMYIKFPETDISTGASSFELVRRRQEAELIKYRRSEKRPKESNKVN